MKLEATDLEKIVTDHITDKGHISRINKELLKLSNKQINSAVKKKFSMFQFQKFFNKIDTQMKNRHLDAFDLYSL